MLKFIIFGLLPFSYSMAQSTLGVEMTRGQEKALKEIGPDRLIIRFDSNGVGTVYNDLAQVIETRSLESFKCKIFPDKKTILGTGYDGGFATDVSGRTYYIDKEDNDLLDTSRCIPK